MIPCSKLAYRKVVNVGTKVASSPSISTVVPLYNETCYNECLTICSREKDKDDETIVFDKCYAFSSYVVDPLCYCFGWTGWGGLDLPDWRHADGFESAYCKA